MLANHALQAVSILQQGGVIAYSTETILGLGCDPFNKQAVEKILWLKARASNKGLILLTDSLENFEKLTQPLSESQRTLIKKYSADAPTTWLIPANSSLPTWITGNQEKVAVRIAQHAVAKQLCNDFGTIISTSANYSGQSVATNEIQIRQWFGPYIDYVIIGDPGSGVASRICDITTGKFIR